MHSTRQPIWLGSTPPAPRRLTTCEEPRLEGPAEALQEVLAQLNQITLPQAEQGLVDGHLVGSLRVTPDAGEVELALSFGACCGQAYEIAEAAFQRLRRALPETDIYVRHAAA